MVDQYEYILLHEEVGNKIEQQLVVALRLVDDDEIHIFIQICDNVAHRDEVITLWHHVRLLITKMLYLLVVVVVISEI